MCGRIALYTPPQRLARLLEAALAAGVDPDAAPSWNVGPQRDALRRRGPRRGSGARRVPLGARPVVGEGPVGRRAATFNARAETVGDEARVPRRVRAPPAARARRRLLRVGPPRGVARCRTTSRGPTASPSCSRGSTSAGATRAPREAPWLTTCTVLTTTPGPDLDGIHDRMPVVLEPRRLRPVAHRARRRARRAPRAVRARARRHARPPPRRPAGSATCATTAPSSSRRRARGRSTLGATRSSSASSDAVMFLPVAIIATGPSSKGTMPSSAAASAMAAEPSRTRPWSTAAVRTAARICASSRVTTRIAEVVDDVDRDRPLLDRAREAVGDRLAALDVDGVALVQRGDHRGVARGLQPEQPTRRCPASRSARPMPESRPPPPTGTSRCATSGSWSSSSVATVD